MRVTTRLGAMRRRAGTLMVDECTITAPGDGEPVYDPETGGYTDPPRVTVYSGKCRIQVTSIIANAAGSDAGDRMTIVQGAEIQLPVDGTESVAISHVAHIDASPNDPALVDREFTISARFEKTHAVSRRLRMQEVTG